MTSGNAPTWDARQWKRIRGILEQALALPQSERPAFLENACGGNSQERDEVESLIAAAGNSAFFDRPAVAPEPLDPVAEGFQPAPGAMIGPYQIQSKVGKGGMGVVYKATDTRLERTVALKILSGEESTREERIRFQREAKAASALNHPNIVTIYEYDSVDGRDFIVMEFVEGETMRKLLDAARLPLETVLLYARQAAEGVRRAHSAGIVHRDLKPNNIMVNGEGVAKILDFGLARRGTSREQGPDELTGLTSAGSIVGTPAYMSPEQATGEPIDYRTDIFSFGIVLYEIACGKQPFRGTNYWATIHNVASLEPAPVAEMNPGVPLVLAQLIDRCLKKKPEERPQSMAEVAAGLDAAIGLKLPATTPVRPVWYSRRFVLAGAAVGGAGFAAQRWFSQRESSRGGAPAAAPPGPVAAPKLSFSLEAQKITAGQPAGEPRAITAADILEGVWRLRLRAQAREPGTVYLIDDGPDQNRAYQISVLSITPLTAGQPMESKWFRLEGTPGTERLWIVWARTPVPDLESVPADAEKIRRLLAGLARNETPPGGQELSGSGDILGTLTELRRR